MRRMAMAAALAATPAGAATFTLTKVTIAGASSVTATALNAGGAIVGSFADAKGSHGFVLSAGTVRVLPGNPPGCGAPLPTAINTAGDVAGSAPNASLGPVAFLWNRQKYLPPAQFPLGAGNPNAFVGVNDKLSMFFNVYTGGGHYLAYAGRPGHFDRFTPPGVGFLVLSQNKAGVLAGDVYSGCANIPSGQCDFFGPTNNLFNIYPPGAFAAFQGHVGNSGVVAGVYVASAEGPELGFAAKNGRFVSFAPGDSAGTISVQGVNPSGRVVGAYQANSGQQLGYLFNGSTVSTFGGFPAADKVAVAISDAGEILLSVTDGAGVGTSYTVACSGTGC